ncbi:hypothetical protein HanXRQr2_Chr17g0810071 [Helianthus annuus]|uniref:Uncharacterized protein n=1 Tax=Helianthus annuus TaxID=4232 RepID=A0A251RRI3_HELAN|nr:hypothetical protein HanXRQr2_Chr17g0810071 [Helianthus annuus]
MHPKSEDEISRVIAGIDISFTLTSKPVAKLLADSNRAGGIITVTGQVLTRTDLLNL